MAARSARHKPEPPADGVAMACGVCGHRQILPVTVECPACGDRMHPAPPTEKEKTPRAKPPAADLAITCSCGARLFGRAHWAGRKVACPQCGKRLRLPDKKAAPPPAPPPPPPPPAAEKKRAAAWTPAYAWILSLALLAVGWWSWRTVTSLSAQLAELRQAAAVARPPEPEPAPPPVAVPTVMPNDEAGAAPLTIVCPELDAIHVFLFPHTDALEAQFDAADRLKRARAQLAARFSPAKGTRAPDAESVRLRRLMRENADEFRRLAFLPEHVAQALMAPYRQFFPQDGAPAAEDRHFAPNRDTMELPLASGRYLAIVAGIDPEYADAPVFWLLPIHQTENPARATLTLADATWRPGEEIRYAEP